MERTSVIIPTFNREKFLVEALESVLAQTLQPAEILVMDDGSTDNTSARMHTYGDRIKYIAKENSGKADTLNQALKRVQHPLVWIMDDDDIAQPDALENMTRLIDGQQEYGLAYGKYNRFHIEDGKDERIIRDGGYWAECEEESFFPTLLQDFFVHHPGMLVRKTAYDAAGPFSLKYPRLEDYEMLVRLAQVTRAKKTDSIVFLQRQHDGDRVGGLEAANRTQRWIDEEKLFFSELYDTLPLQSYIPAASNDELPELEKREALIQRGVIMARKKLWNLTISDFTTACDIKAEISLRPKETQALRQILFSKYGCPEIVSDQTISKRLKQIAKLSAVGRSIAKTIARGQIWFVRNAAQSRNIKATKNHLILMTSLLVAGTI